MKVSIQGIKGAFHEEAAINYFNQSIEIVPQITFRDIIKSIDNKAVNCGIMAVENTISGTIHSNLNLILESDLKISGEVYLRIKQNLAVKKGVKIENLKQVQSHYMAIDQCRLFFRNFPHIKLVESDDTALSMKEVSEFEDNTVGAIGSEIAAKQYNLEIIAKSIETNKKNYTRFLILKKLNGFKEPAYNKASICLFLPHKKGSLSKVLSIISFYDIDLTKIESVPVIGEPWHYMFYIDLIFDSPEKFENLIFAIKPLSDKIEILGRYKSGVKSFEKIHSDS